MKKADKVIEIIYLLSAAAFFIFLFISAPTDSFFFNYGELFGIIPLLLFIILALVFKKLHKNEINKELVNPFAKRMKNLSFIIFTLLTISFTIVSIILNKESYYLVQNSYFYIINHIIFDVSRDVICRVIFPIFSILFLINFRKNKDISLRYSNLKSFALVSLFLLVLIQFSMLIGQTFYDLGLFIFLKLHLIS